VSKTSAQESITIPLSLHSIIISSIPVSISTLGCFCYIGPDLQTTYIVGLWIIAAWQYDVMATLPIATNPFPIVLAGVATHFSAYLYMCGPPLYIWLCI
jgi:hypothetical protein